MNKVLIFDGQVFQTSAWDRGMGKYSLSLLGAMARLWDKNQKVYIVFTTRYSLSDEVQTAISAVLPNVQKIFLDLEVPLAHEFEYALGEVMEKLKENERILTKFIESLNLQKTTNAEYLILSLFLDEVCAAFPRGTVNTLLFYDLIPLLFAERYSRIENHSYYLARIPMILKADKILAISQTVADDLSMYLGIAPDRITNIQGASISRLSIKSQPMSLVREKFVLMTSGNDMRKNNINAVRGFEEYIASTGRTDLRLVITSHFDEAAQLNLKTFSDHLVFTGNVSENELKWLYENAELVMFVPEYEGLGLPILEAVEFSQPIVCSFIGAFREISEDAFYYADPQFPSSISEALGRAFNGEERQQRLSMYPDIVKRYTWHKTATQALRAIERTKIERMQQKKKKIAVVGPTPRGYSAIGKVLQQMHPSLTRYFDVDYYLEGGVSTSDSLRPDYLEYATNVYSAADFNADAYARYDAVLYHIGNSEYHLNTIKSALYLPGYVIIHDTKLPEIFAMAQNMGYITENRREAEVVLDKMSGITSASYLSTLIGNQLGVVVHSNYALKSLQELSSFLHNKLAIKKINLPTGSSKAKKQKQDGGINVGMAGVIHEGKGLGLLETLTSQGEFGNLNFSIFGVPVAPQEVMDRITQNESIRVMTNLTDRAFQDEISRLDILINYREEYRGETSLSTLEAMRVGVVPIVRNVGWYSELPDSVAIKLDDSKDIPEVLQKVLNGFIDIKAMSEKAREYTARYHSYDAYSEQLSELIAMPAESKKVEAIKNGDSDELLKLLTEDI